MSYQVLARKWRPHNFSEVIGQQHVLKALANALEQGRLHHAYLLSGTRGVGKTTIARILAKSLNCETGITSRPCGQCAACREIDQGSFVDLLEIDAASRTKVEDTREILDNVQYRPARGRFKVYLIDEVHMLSRHSFNALLKTLEEPPEHVKFLLATTDPQKLPVTILSRCLQFHLKSLTVEQIAFQLGHVLQQEGNSFQPAALDALARAADGSMRDALSLTDQALAFGGGELRLDDVLAMLGTLDHRQIHRLLHYIAAGDAQGLIGQVGELVALGADFEQVHLELASALHCIAMAQVLPESNPGRRADDDEIGMLAERLAPSDVQLFYQMAVNGRRDLPHAPDGRVALEMTLLRMLAFAPVEMPSGPVTVRPASRENASGQSPAAPVTALPQSSPTGGRHATPAADVTPSPASRIAAEDPPTAVTVQAGPPPGSSSVAPSAGLSVTSKTGLDPADAQVPGDTSLDNILRARNFLRSKKLRQGAAADDRPPQRRAEPGGSPDAGVQVARSDKRARDASEQLTGVAADGDEIPPWLLEDDHGGEEESPGGFDDRHLSETGSSAGLPMAAESSMQQGDVPAADLAVPLAVRAGAGTGVPLPADNMVDLSRIESTEVWREVIERANMSGRLRQLAMNSCIRRDPGGALTLVVQPHQQHLAKVQAKPLLAQAFRKACGEECGDIEFEIGDPGREPPLEMDHRCRQQRLQQVRADLLADDNVQFFMQRFAAELDEESIKPK